MAKRRQNPIVNGEPYQLVVLRVMKFDAQGRPSEAVIGYDETTFHIDHDTANNFVTAYVPARVIAQYRKAIN